MVFWLIPLLPQLSTWFMNVPSLEPIYIKKSCLRQEGWHDLCHERFVDGFQLSNPLKWIFMKDHSIDINRSLRLME